MMHAALGLSTIEVPSEFGDLDMMFKGGRKGWKEKDEDQSRRCSLGCFIPPLQGKLGV